MKSTIFATVPSLLDDLINSFAVFFASLVLTEEAVLIITYVLSDSFAAFFDFLASLEDAGNLPFNISSINCRSRIQNIRDDGHVRSDLNRCLSVKPIFNIPSNCYSS